MKRSKMNGPFAACPLHPVVASCSLIFIIDAPLGLDCLYRCIGSLGHHCQLVHIAIRPMVDIERRGFFMVQSDRASYCHWSSSPTERNF
jgi:hypothetical protein